nr:MAG TPA: hypothetical protein [Caudoviricetes sp.]
MCLQVTSRRPCRGSGVRCGSIGASLTTVPSSNKVALTRIQCIGVWSCVTFRNPHSHYSVTKRNCQAKSVIERNFSNSHKYGGK